MDTKRPRSLRVPFGWLYLDAAAVQAIVDGELDIVPYLRRHACGDFGDLTEAERRENEYVMENGGELLAAYKIHEALTLWILGEWDLRGCTVALESGPVPQAALQPEPPRDADGEFPDDIEF